VTDAQILALWRLHFSVRQIKSVRFGDTGLYDLYVSYFDNGGNFHQESYTPDGKLRTHENA
jgi:hypothetical protein